MRTVLGKRLLAALAFVLALASRPIAAEHSPWSFHSELDLFLGLKAGAEYSFSDSFGLRGTLGFCLISPLQVSYTLVGVSHLRPRESGLQIDLEYGLIQAIFDVLEPVVDLVPNNDNTYAYWSPGACAAIGWRFRRGQVLSLRAGAGALFGYDLGAWTGPSFHPNIALQYDFKP